MQGKPRPTRTWAFELSVAIRSEFTSYVGLAFVRAAGHSVMCDGRSIVFVYFRAGFCVMHRIIRSDTGLQLQDTNEYLLRLLCYLLQHCYSLLPTLCYRAVPELTR